MNGDKYFFPIPAKNKIEWCNVVKRRFSKAALYICEDHLNLEEDLLNYQAWHTKDVRGRLKPQVPATLRKRQPKIFQGNNENLDEESSSINNIIIKAERTNKNAEYEDSPASTSSFYVLKPVEFAHAELVDINSAGRTSGLFFNNHKKQPHDPPQSETGDDLSLYINLPKKSTEYSEKSKSTTASARKTLPDKRNYLRHDGITCNSCSRGIVGYRYTCVQCPDYDLCSSCEARGAHCLHYVLRIPKPAPVAEIQSMMNAIRCQLLYGGNKPPEPEPDPVPEPEPEVEEEPCVETLKVEIKDEPDPLQTDDAFQADENYPETSYTETTELPMPIETAQPIQISPAMTTGMLQGNTLLIIENPVSGWSGAAHTAAAADRTKRRLAHASAEPPPPTPPRAHKRARVTHADNLLLEMPIAGTVPVTTVPVPTVPQAATINAPGGREIKEESSFQVFSHIEPKKPQAKRGQSAGKASTSQGFFMM